MHRNVTDKYNEAMAGLSMNQLKDDPLKSIGNLFKMVGNGIAMGVSALISGFSGKGFNAPKASVRGQALLGMKGEANKAVVAAKSMLASVQATLGLDSPPKLLETKPNQKQAASLANPAKSRTRKQRSYHNKNRKKLKAHLNKGPEVPRGPR